MSNDTTVYTLYPEAHLDERGRYFDGQFLTSQDFVDEQRYHVDRLRRALDHLTVSGVAEGLEVTAVGPYKVALAPGVAIDGAGRQLVVLAARDAVDVPKDIPGGVVDVALAYAEIESRIHGGASDEDGTRGASRMRELPALEFTAQGQGRDGTVPLARLRLADNGAITVDNPNPVRRATGLRLPSSGPNAPTLRAGFARPHLLALTGDLQITGKLGVGTPDPEAELDVRGLARVGALSIREQTFKVAGDEAVFYPIVFRDHDWAAGQCILEIFRVRADADVAAAGSLLARLRWHAADGQGNEFLDLDVVQTRRFIAHARPLKADKLLVVWLRGNRSYAWRAGQRVELVDGNAAAKTLGGEKLDPRNTVEPAFDRDRFRLGPALDREELRGGLTVAGDLAYGGKLDHLDVAEANAATIRASDLLLGHMARRGSPGRALVDNKTALFLNYEADWSQVTINSRADITGALNVTGESRFTGGVGGDLKLPGGGLTVAKASAFADKLTITRDAEHLQLVRSKTTTGGVKLFLELFQEDTNPVTTPEVYPAIRFHHGYRYWHRLEARPTGLHVRNGDPGNDTYTSFFAQNINAAGNLVALQALSVTGAASLGDSLAVTKGATFGDNVRITRDAEHLTLYRNASTTGGSRVFLELYQHDGATPETNPAIRFHHNNRYWHRLESRSDGLTILDGDLASGNLRNLWAGNLMSHGLHTVTGKDERLRMIRGTVSETGGVVYGSGYSVEKDTNKSVWKVTFTSSFANPPSVVVTQQYPNDGGSLNSGDTRDNAIVVHVDNGHVWIKTGDANGSMQWRKFHFIAVGP